MADMADMADMDELLFFLFFLFLLFLWLFLDLVDRSKMWTGRDELLFHLYLWCLLRPCTHLTLLIGVSKELKSYSGPLSSSSIHFLI